MLGHPRKLPTVDKTVHAQGKKTDKDGCKQKSRDVTDRASHLQGPKGMTLTDVFMFFLEGDSGLKGIKYLAGRPLGAAIFRSEAFMWLNDWSLQSISNAFQMAAQQARRLGP